MLRLFLFLLLPATLPAAPTVTLEKGTVVVSGVSDAKGLRLVVTGGTDKEVADRPAMSGEWTSTGGKVVFAPKYSLKPGATYRVFLADGKSLDVAVPADTADRQAALTGISPGVTEIPENVLRFYLHFDKPMPRGDVYKYVQVVKEDGTQVPQPFLKLDDELWNPDQTRLTLLIEPGRIKREVKPLIDLGPVFAAGNKYTLVVSGEWPTLAGKPLGRDLRKPITAVTRLEDAPDPKKWTITSPAAGRDELKVAFGRPMDHALLARTLSVIGPDGSAVRGTGAAADFDRAWTFKPAADWVPRSYKLRVNSILEDVCGNAIGHPFEVELGKPNKPVEPKDIDVPFTVSRK
jgi:hypothetical protein